MLRLGKYIRLTGPEVDRFTKITNIAPMNVRTLGELEAYIAKCKRHYWGQSPDIQFLHWMLDQERLRCYGGYRD